MRTPAGPAHSGIQISEATQDDAGPAEADREDEQDSQPGDLDGPGDAAAAQDATASPGQQDGDDEAGASAAPGPETEQPGSHDAPTNGDHEDAVPDQPDDEAAPNGAQDAEVSEDPREGDAASADSDGEASDAPDPALLTDLIERLGQVRAAADAAEVVLTANGDLKTALAGLDEIYDQAAQARRSLKAAIGGQKAAAVRSGGLRDKVLAHLDEHPDGEFTPHEIHKVLSHSSGAIANALDTLVKLGEAELATDKPRRFRRAARPAGAAPGADGAGSAEDDRADLAGAA
jgi:hypothetical protein